MNAQGHPASDAPDRQLAGENRVASADDLHLLACESNVGMILHVEKVSAPEMSIAVRLSCPDFRGFDRSLDRSGLRVRRIKKEGAVNVFEMAADGSYHHVTHAKLRRRMPRLEKPFGHSSLLRSKDTLWN